MLVPQDSYMHKYLTHASAKPRPLTEGFEYVAKPLSLSRPLSAMEYVP